MISPFLSKLITTRQAAFTEDEIDIFEMKYFLQPMDSLVDFQKKLNDEKMMEDFGYLISESIVNHFKKRYSIEEGKIMSIWTNLFDLSGFGKLKVVNFNDTEAFFQIENNNFAKSYKDKYGTQKLPVCHIIRGILRNVYEKTTGKKVTCTENQCIAKGNVACSFKVQSI